MMATARDNVNRSVQVPWPALLPWLKGSSRGNAAVFELYSALSSVVESESEQYQAAQVREIPHLSASQEFLGTPAVPRVPSSTRTPHVFPQEAAQTKFQSHLSSWKNRADLETSLAQQGSPALVLLPHSPSWKRLPQPAHSPQEVLAVAEVREARSQPVPVAR